MVMFLRFGESPPKTENLIKRMDRPLPSFSAKITLFVTYPDLNSMATVFLEIYRKSNQFFPYDYFLVTYGDHFYTNVT